MYPIFKISHTHPARKQKPINSKTPKLFTTL